MNPLFDNPCSIQKSKRVEFSPTLFLITKLVDPNRLVFFINFFTSSVVSCNNFLDSINIGDVPIFFAT